VDRVISLVGLVLLAAVLVAHAAPRGSDASPSAGAPREHASAAPAKEGEGAVVVAEFPQQKRRLEGDELQSWMDRNGWKALMGAPRFFFIEGGALHLVSRPGPIYRKRVWLAVFNRDRLRHGIENQVVLRITPQEFRISPEQYPTISFKMAPEKLPASGADMLDPDKNDTAFCLMVGFDHEWHEFKGIRFPDTVAYVWANRKWDELVGSDPDYREFMRYIPIGYGGKGLGKPREFRRNLLDDFRLAFPERDTARTPDVVQVGLMIDSNTLGGESRSSLYWIRFDKKKLARGKG